MLRKKINEKNTQFWSKNENMAAVQNAYSTSGLMAKSNVRLH